MTDIYYESKGVHTMIEKTLKDLTVQASTMQQPQGVRPIETSETKREMRDELTVSQAKDLTASMNRFLETVDTQLRFQFHEELNEYYVTIVNSQTEEVVREIPSKRLMDIYAAMREFIGVLVDQKI